MTDDGPDPDGSPVPLAAPPGHPRTRSRFGYPKVFRLRRGSDIRRVQRKGRRHRVAFGTVCTLPNDLGHPRFGFAVSRKVGNAVVRNRVKRRLREVFRHLRPTLGGIDVLVLARPEASGASLVDLRAGVERALRDAPGPGLHPPPPAVDERG